MDDPERGVDQSHALDEHALALHDVDELRAQALAASETSFVRIHALLCHLLQAVAGAQILCFFGYAGLVAKALFAAHSPPRGVAASSVYGTFTSDGDVGGLTGIDTWTVVPTLQSLPARLDEGIEFGVEDKTERSILADDKVDVAQQMQCACAPRACGDNDTSTAALRHLGDGTVDGFLIFCCTGLRAGTITGDEHFTVGLLGQDGGTLDALHSLVVPG